MNSSSPRLALAAFGLVLSILLLLDFAFNADIAVFVAFVPALVWATILALRERQ